MYISQVMMHCQNTKNVQRCLMEICCSKILYLYLRKISHNPIRKQSSFGMHRPSWNMPRRSPWRQPAMMARKKLLAQLAAQNRSVIHQLSRNASWRPREPELLVNPFSTTTVGYFRTVNVTNFLLILSINTLNLWTCSTYKCFYNASQERSCAPPSDLCTGTILR